MSLVSAQEHRRSRRPGLIDPNVLGTKPISVYSHGQYVTSGDDLSYSTSITIPSASCVFGVQLGIDDNNSFSSWTFGGVNITTLINNPGDPAGKSTFLGHIYHPPTGSNTFTVDIGGSGADDINLIWWVLENVKDASHSLDWNDEYFGGSTSFSKAPVNGGILLAGGWQGNPGDIGPGNVTTGTVIEEYSTGTGTDSHSAAAGYQLGDGSSKTVAIDWPDSNGRIVDWSLVYEPL